MSLFARCGSSVWWGWIGACVWISGCSKTNFKPQKLPPSSEPPRVSSNHFDRLFQRMGKLGGDLTWSMGSPAPVSAPAPAPAPVSAPSSSQASRGTESVSPLPVHTGETKTPFVDTPKPAPYASLQMEKLRPAPVTTVMRNVLWRAACDVLKPFAVEENNAEQGRLRTSWITWADDPQHRICIGVWIDQRRDWDHAVHVEVKHQQWIQNQWCHAPEKNDLAVEVKTSIMNHARSCWKPAARSAT